MDIKESYFKSNINFYWLGYSFIVLAIILVNMFIIKDFKKFSFEFYFLLMIPMWIGCLSINNYETERLKKVVREYINQYYPKKIIEFDEKPIELLNSETEDILDLLKDQQLITDPTILKFQLESKKITTFMYSVFISMPIILFMTVFIILRW